MKLQRLMLGLVLATVTLGVTGASVFASMTSTNYEIRFDHIGSGGDDTSSSASYQLRDTVGGNAIDQASSSSYELAGGFRDGIFDEVSTFELFMTNGSSQVATSALASNVITVGNSAGYSSGDMIALVQDAGIGQTAAVARVTSVGVGSVTVDAFSPATPVIDGTDDYLYNLTASSISLGTLTDSTVNLNVVAWEVNAEVDDGYAVYVFEDEDLSTVSDAYTITDVADGAVTAGVSEYGALSSDTSLATSTFDTVDTGFTTSPQLIASRSALSRSTRDFLTLKASIDATQQESSYSHNLSFIYVGDY